MTWSIHCTPFIKSVPTDSSATTFYYLSKRIKFKNYYFTKIRKDSQFLIFKGFF